MQSLQVDLDKSIKKNIEACIPSMIEQQFKEKIAPMVLTHIKGVEKQVKEEVMPVVEQQMVEVFAKLVSLQQAEVDI